MMMPWKESKTQALGRTWAAVTKVLLVSSKGNQAPPKAARIWAKTMVPAMMACSERKTAEIVRPTDAARSQSETIVSNRASGLRK